MSTHTGDPGKSSEIDRIVNQELWGNSPFNPDSERDYGREQHNLTPLDIAIPEEEREEILELNPSLRSHCLYLKKTEDTVCHYTCFIKTKLQKRASTEPTRCKTETLIKHCFGNPDSCKYKIYRNDNKT